MLFLHSFGDFVKADQLREFFGIYETDPAVYNSLSPDLQQTVTNFTGSFNRESSTSQDGTTPAAYFGRNGIATSTAVQPQKRQ